MTSSVPLTPVTRVSSPIREQAVETIRSQIMDGTLREGQRLVERALCEQLQISRNTLREAYRQLEAEGFVELKPHRGPSVRRLTPEEARALYEVREALEGLAVRLFTERASDGQLDELAEAYRDLRESHRSADVLAMIRSKNAFYAVMYNGADNEVLSSQAKMLQDRLSLLRVRSLSAKDRPQNSIEEIAHVCSLIARRQPDEASAAWCRHIRNAYESTRQILTSGLAE
jgi:DNA-binding GntR family transcriptional regulator